jgi:tRNA(Phe) wybutosine-synthesizing methylase Tyw3
MIQVPQELLVNTESISEIEINKKVFKLGVNILNLYKERAEEKIKINKEQLEQLVKSLQND